MVQSSTFEVEREENLHLGTLDLEVGTLEASLAWVDDWEQE